MKKWRCPHPQLVRITHRKYAMACAKCGHKLRGAYRIFETETEKIRTAALTEAAAELRRVTLSGLNHTDFAVGVQAGIAEAAYIVEELSGTQTDRLMPTDLTLARYRPGFFTTWEEAREELEEGLVCDENTPAPIPQNQPITLNAETLKVENGEAELLAAQRENRRFVSVIFTERGK